MADGRRLLLQHRKRIYAGEFQLRSSSERKATEKELRSKGQKIGVRYSPRSPKLSVVRTEDQAGFYGGEYAGDGPPPRNTPIGLRIDQPPENVARRTVHPPPPNYHDREVRVECKTACRRGVRGWCRPPSPPWHSPRARAQHARRCSAMPLRSAQHERTTSIPAHRWRGRWSCPRCEAVRIFLFRPLVLRPAPQSASEPSQASP